MNIKTRRLLALLDYAQETMRTRSRAVPDVSSHGSFILFDHQVEGFEGARVGAGESGGEDDVWLSVAKPPGPEVPPEPADPWLVPWLSVGTLTKSLPSLAREVDGAALIAVGTHRDASRTASDLSVAAKPGVELGTRIELDDYAFRADVERLYSQYLQSEWKPWVERERRRRRQSHLYGRLFTLHQQLSGELTETQLELVWGMGVATRRTPGEQHSDGATASTTDKSDPVADAVYSYPLVTRLVDVGFNEQTRAAEVRPRNLDARLEVDGFLSSQSNAAAEADKAAAKCVLESDKSVSPHAPETYAPLIDIATRAIEGDGQGAVDVKESWVLFARPRGSGVAAQDLERMRKIVIEHGDTSLPGAVSCLVSEPDDAAGSNDLPAFRGYNATYRESMDSVAAEDLFFPKPFNDEQARVAQQLEVSDGVVVQGPPGTGKSHTIANIICHWLANGRRVLVTSMRDPALAVLHDQLPESIRPLVISLLASEQEGVNQLERSIEKIASEVQGLNQDVLRNEIERLETGIDALQGKLARLDRDLTRWARLNLARIDLQGHSIDPQDATLEVMRNTGNFEWIPDALGVGPQYSPQFDEKDIGRLRQARIRLGTDVEYVGCDLPAPEELPDVVELISAHHQLQRLVTLNEKSIDGALQLPADAGPDSLRVARELASKIDEIKGLEHEITSAMLPWRNDTAARIRRRDPKGVFDALDALAEDIDRASQMRSRFLSRPVQVPEIALTSKDFLQALDNLSQGRRAFALTAFGKADARKQIRGVQVNGLPPANPDDWQHVADFVSMQRKRRELTARWNALAPEVGFKPVLGTETVGQLSVDSQFSLYRSICRLCREQRLLTDKVETVFPAWSRAAVVADDPEALDELTKALEYHLMRGSLGQVSSVVDQFHKNIDGSSGRLVDSMRAFLLQRLGKADLEESVLISNWTGFKAELERIRGLAEPLHVVEEVTRKIFNSGGIKLATLLARPLEADGRDLLPATFMRDWRLRRLGTHLALIDSQSESRKLNDMRTSIEKDLARLYGELVVQRTWFKLAENVTPSVRAALQSYLNAIQRIGKGGGKRAHRYRQDARYAAAEAHKAIPCWIMPHHRVSETLPAQLGSFDLVVIDESSQSDLSALPILMRAKKILVVGDDRQVSPQAIGMEEDRVRALMQSHLSEQVPLYRAQLAPDRSFYDLARVVFAKNSVMLREHFRCVAPIIEYARREFYNNEIFPLRLPRSSERIDPPLQDVHITNGHRENGINEQEVDFIVTDITRRLQDAKLQDRTIGVVSLLGENQALRIWDRLLNELGAPLGRDTFAQRFNVAASRARDQMILVRSVDLNDLTDADRLRRGLIQHFARPFGEEPVKVATTRELCESQLERDIYEWLNSNGYRVMPQVRVGAYKIDLVVEGENDTRLAVECDGDKYEGAELWMQSIRRQRALERTGWVFWRCFSTSFLRRREDVLEDLRKTLDSQGIEPTRSGGWARRKITETRRVMSRMSARAA